MIFTGKNLRMVRRGVELALVAIHIEIATCSDVFMYADELEELEVEQAKFEALLKRIDKKLEKENG